LNKNLILAYNFCIYSITALAMKIAPKYNFPLRKWAAKKSVPTFVDKIEIIGDIDTSAQLFVSNHQNMVDIPIIEYVLIQQDLAWVAKKELGDIFLFGNLLKGSDAILIDREDKKSLIELLKLAKDRLNKQKQLVIFPEGTRNKNPRKLLPFKAGTKLLVQKYNLKVQPLVLIGIDKIITFEPFEIKKGVLKVVALPSFYPQDKQWYEKLYEDMQATIDTHTSDY